MENHKTDPKYQYGNLSALLEFYKNESDFLVKIGFVRREWVILSIKYELINVKMNMVCQSQNDCCSTGKDIFNIVHQKFEYWGLLLSFSTGARLNLHMIFFHLLHFFQIWISGDSSRLLVL